jgi:hypothetical protein
MTRIRIVGCIAGLALAVTACASRPTEDELTTAILTAADADATVELDETQARCIAQFLLDESELSDTTLAGLAEDFDNPQVLETEVDQVKPLVEQAAVACV